MARRWLFDRLTQFVGMHLRDEVDVLLDDLGELRERAEAVEKIGPHRQDKFGGAVRVLRDLDQRRNESRAQLLVADGENFLELIDEEEPLVAAPLQSLNQLRGCFWLGFRELARLSLTEPGALHRAAERLEWIHVRHESEIAERRADQLRQLRQQPRAHD